MTTGSFFVTGLATPQGSKSAWVNPKTNRAVIIDAGSKQHRKDHQAWRGAVAAGAQAWTAANEPWVPLDEPVQITLDFLFPPVASAPYRVLHAVSPDLDKLARSVLDGLTTGGLLRDDSRVAMLTLSKQYAPPGGVVGCTVAWLAMGNVEKVRAAARRSATVLD